MQHTLAQLHYEHTREEKKYAQQIKDDKETTAFTCHDAHKMRDYVAMYGPLPNHRAHPEGVQEGIDEVYREVERRGHRIWHDTDLTVYIIVKRREKRAQQPEDYKTGKERKQEPNMDPEGKASAAGSSTSSWLTSPAAMKGTPTPRGRLPVGGSMASGGNQAKEPHNPPQHKRQSLQDLRQIQKDITTQNKANHSTTHDLTSAGQQTGRPVGDPGSLVEIRPVLGPSDEYSEGPQPRREEHYKDNLATHSRAKPRPR